LKIELSKMLIANKKNFKEGQVASVKIFSITDGVRDFFIKQYTKYILDLFTIKFIIWREKKIKFKDPDANYMLTLQIPKY
jgi:hypothetical protein